MTHSVAERIVAQVNIPWGIWIKNRTDTLQARYFRQEL